jgi:hypothetical protein
MLEYCAITELLGKTLVSVEVNEASNEVMFVTNAGETYRMFHDQDCCEDVYLEDVVGDLQDLVGQPILVAEEVFGETPQDFDPNDVDSYTWTFYKFATRRGWADLRWLGVSNGYYSETVSFAKDCNEPTL